jgi:hypothetical protein
MIPVTGASRRDAFNGRIARGDGRPNMDHVIPATTRAQALRRRAAEFENLARQTRDPLLLQQFTALREGFEHAARAAPKDDAA